MVTQQRIVVINPNSNQSVTDGMAEGLKPFSISGGPEIKCITLIEGPFGIESQDDVDAVIFPLRDCILRIGQADAYVIACYSDPGLDICRTATKKPVFGIQESGVLTALSKGNKFGVIAITDSSIKRHLRYLRQMGVMKRLAKERSAGLTVEESVTGKGTFDRLCEVGAQLRDLDGADSVILGCAGMASHRNELEKFLGIPVVEPVQAATSMAIGAVLLS
jgi:Asp/Glu/hydantoin racemase